MVKNIFDFFFINFNFNNYLTILDSIKETQKNIEEAVNETSDDPSQIDRQNTVSNSNLNV